MAKWRGTLCLDAIFVLDWKVFYVCGFDGQIEIIKVNLRVEDNRKSLIRSFLDVQVCHMFCHFPDINNYPALPGMCMPQVEKPAFPRSYETLSNLLLTAKIKNSRVMMREQKIYC